jgi:hypothetical protein
MDELQLATWLHAVNLEPGSERQAAIAAAAKELAAAAKGPDVAGYVLLAYGRPDADSFEGVRTAVSSHDVTFGCASGDLESQLIGAVCVAECLARSGAAATIAAHCVLSAEWVGLKAQVPDLRPLAIETLAKRSELSRNRSEIAAAADLSKALAQLPPFDQDGQAVVHQDGRALMTAMTSSFSVIKGALETLAKTVSSRVRASDEELDLLWWVLSGFSNSLGKPWKSVSNAGLAAIAAGAEFKDLLKFSIEPISTRALLARQLAPRADTEVNLGSAAAATAKQAVMSGLEGGHVLLPVLSCLSEYAALGGKPAWKGSVERWGVDPQITVTCLDLAEQCVRERLLAPRLI